MNKLALSPYLSVQDTALALRNGELSSEKLVENQLNRIARFDDHLHSFVEVYTHEARRAARALDDLRRSGTDLGPLHGVTVAIKDLFHIKGRYLQAGSRAREAQLSDLTATVVERLRAAGAIILGKTHTVEFAFGGWGTNAVMGTPWNPWDLKQHRVPGGSSSGSAVAVAAGLCCAALGTDTGGSIRIPAGLCGLVGLKTTHGLVSRHGLVELCPTHDTVGPITRTVGDAALLLDAIAGPDPLDPASESAPVRSVAPHLGKDVRGLRVWVLPRTERQGVDADVLAAYDRALRTLVELGMQPVERVLPQSLTESMRIAGQLMSAEGYANLGELFEQNLKFDPHVRRRVLLGRDTGAAKYIALLKERDQARRNMLAALEDVDVLFLPTNAISAIPVSAVDELATPLSRFGRFANLLDLCAVAVQSGLSPQGLPISVQFVGRPHCEPLVLRAAQAYERATPWHTAVPKGLD
jgi:aspartyl-tRNA(Asn)/glutamyl-tRNA(Gln) amidotransferase subunit A